ncbi:universal stress protein UspA, partial [Oenococcus oeni]
MSEKPIDKVFNRILVGVDDSADAQLAFRYAVRRAVKDNATLIITSILENDEMNVYQALTKDYVHGERDELVEHLKKYRDIAAKAGVKDIKEIVDEGDAGETIVKNVIPAVKADLLIIGSLSKKG